jgi:hypothetical protein
MECFEKWADRINITGRKKERKKERMVKKTQNVGHHLGGLLFFAVL